MAVKKCTAASSHAGTDWNLHITEHEDQSITVTTDRIQVILLQEIRDQLKWLNTLLHCSNTRKIPRELSGLRRDVKALTKALTDVKALTKALTKEER